MKKAASFLLITLVIYFVPIVSMAINPSIDLYLNGKKVDAKVPPMVQGNEPFIPVQFISDHIGVKTDWNANDQTVTLYHQHQMIELQARQSYARIDGKVVQLKWTPYTHDGHLYVPLSFLSEQIDIRYIWDRLTYSISIYKKAGPPLSAKEAFESEASKDIVIYPPDSNVHDSIDHHDSATNHRGDQLRKYKIVIDAGHGGKDPGAIGASGAYEKEFTLSLAKKIQSILDADVRFQTLMTRVDDRQISLEDRVSIANVVEADLFISIHGNTFTSKVSGSETYYWKEDSYEFARIMHQYILEATGFPDRQVRKSPYRVIKDTMMPAILLEIGYLSNEEEEKKLLDDAFQHRVAESIVLGIKEVLKLD